MPAARRRAGIGGLSILLVVVVVGVLTSGSSPPNSRQPPSVPFYPGSSVSTDPFAKGTKVALGINTDGPPGPTLDAYTRLVGEKPKIFMWYSAWGKPLFDASQLQPVASRGVVPMITWDPIHGGLGIPLSEIAAGRYDAYIRSAAAAAVAWKHRIYIRFAHEMNLAAAPFGPGRDGNTAMAFVSAWRHVVSIFRSRGASNVEWVWSPNVYCERHCPFTTFYPGDRWVDWVALDGYNYSTVDGDPWLTFDQIFGPSYKILTQMTSRPVMIGETASTELGGSKAQWIRSMGSDLSSDFPRVRALIWFDHVKETDWRVNSSPASLAAFRTLVRSPVFLP